MELIFIIGIVTLIILQYVNKSFKSPTKAERPEQRKYRSVISYDTQETATNTTLKNQKAYIDIHQAKEKPFTTTTPKMDTKVSEKTTTKKVISLNSLSEAKRAFIYSEIFNRKY